MRSVESQPADERQGDRDLAEIDQARIVSAYFVNWEVP
jgi:hypothetical protein